MMLCHNYSIGPNYSWGSPTIAASIFCDQCYSWGVTCPYGKVHEERGKYDSQREGLTVSFNELKKLLLNKRTHFVYYKSKLLTGQPVWAYTC